LDLCGRPGREDVLDVEDWAEVRRLHRAEGLSIKAIARRTGIARNTVRSALRSDAPPTYERAGPGSIVDAVEPRIRELLAEFPDMPATVIAERIGWERSLTVLKDRVRELRPLYAPADPCQRTYYEPGELAQWDLWFPAVDIPFGFGEVGRPPVIVGVSGFSRVIVARMIPSREHHDVLCGHLACLVALGAVPRKGVYDQEPAIGRWRGPKAEFTQAFTAFRGVLGMGAVLCARGDPEAKGLVERANRYLETSFLPGRRFVDPADFNAQLIAWLVRANGREHRTLRIRPCERAWEDRGAMLALPPVLPDPALRFQVRLGRDHYVRVATNDYSVHPKAIGRRVEVRADLDWVVATCGNEEVARHPRCWASHQTLEVAEHGRARRALREAARAGRPPEVAVEERDLTDYDRALGVA
jgi:transposase